jgi:heavy metal sensor kinase
MRPPRPPHPFALEIWRSNVADIKLNEHEFELPTSRRSGDYFQININHWGKPLRSRSLGDRSFPDPDGFGGDNLLYWEPDDFELAPGHWVRRVRVKAAPVRPVNIRPPGGGRGGPGGQPEVPMPVTTSASSSPSPSTASEPETTRQPRRSRPDVFIVLQVAADRSRLTNPLDRLRDDRDEQVAKLKEETAMALSRLLNRLLGISSLTFAATVLGTWLLVRAGLRPLRRMSEAVSKVSPRDFRLPLGNEVLPQELRPISERLTAALDQLKRAFAREKQATADISHELRTPLAALLTTTELALRKQRSAEQYREMLEECRSSAKQMNQIVERLLTLARIDAGVDRVRPQSVDVAVLAAQCAAVVRPLAEARGLCLSVLGCSAPGEDLGSARLTTDPDKLREVVNNLLYNAIQYNRPEGRIDLKVDRANGHVCLEVRDTGIGIPQASRDLIFERFYRADPSRNGDGMNAGLGLAIVKEYVDLLGGRIAVESIEGQGSTFRVELPATPAVLA